MNTDVMRQVPRAKKPTLNTIGRGGPMKINLFPAFVALFSSVGCIVVDSEPDVIVVEEEPVAVNLAPNVNCADGGCYWDSYYYDDIWVFEADVDDADSPYDVIEVWADVYDAYSGMLVDTFELYPTTDPYYWFSDWLGSSTYLDCWGGHYFVEMVAYDVYQDYDVYTFEPWVE